jgi:flagellar basal-body rod protein FlgC
MDAYEISASAMTAQRLRLDVIASNLANVNTTRKADGTIGAYHRKNVVFAPILQQQMGGGGGFAPSMPFIRPGGGTADGGRMISFDGGIPTLKATIGREQPFEGSGVKVMQIVDDTKTPLKLVYDPNHPDANADGYVAMPNINPVTEMVDMIAATRAYEANVSSVQATKVFGKAALEI